MAGLFSAALSGMNQIIKKDFCKKSVPNTKAETISLESPDQTSLLIDFLSDILTLSHIHRLIYCRVEFKILTGTKLEAEVFGSFTDNFDEDIKAVSYHGAEIVKNSDGNYQTNILFDI